MKALESQLREVKGAYDVLKAKSKATFQREEYLMGELVELSSQLSCKLLTDLAFFVMFVFLI